MPSIDHYIKIGVNPDLQMRGFISPDGASRLNNQIGHKVFEAGDEVRIVRMEELYLITKKDGYSTAVEGNFDAFVGVHNYKERR